MSAWQETTLGETTELFTGFPFKSANYTNDENGIALVRGDNVVQGRFRWDDVKRWPKIETAELSDYFLQPGDVILAMDRPWIDAGLKYACVADEDLPCLLVQRVTRLTAPYMHDGRFTTLDQVVGFYTSNVVANPNLSPPLIAPGGGPLRLNLTTNQQAALVAFLKTLTDTNLATNPQLSDPFNYGH